MVPSSAPERFCRCLATKKGGDGDWRAACEPTDRTGRFSDVENKLRCSDVSCAAVSSLYTPALHCAPRLSNLTPPTPPRSPEHVRVKPSPSSPHYPVHPSPRPTERNHPLHNEARHGTPASAGGAALCARRRHGVQRGGALLEVVVLSAQRTFEVLSGMTQMVSGEGQSRK